MLVVQTPSSIGVARGWKWLDFSSFRPSFGGDEQKKVVNFFQEKSAPQKNSGYAYALVPEIKCKKYNLIKLNKRLATAL